MCYDTSVKWMVAIVNASFSQNTTRLPLNLFLILSRLLCVAEPSVFCKATLIPCNKTKTKTKTH